MHPARQIAPSNFSNLSNNGCSNDCPGLLLILSVGYLRLQRAPSSRRGRFSSSSSLLKVVNVPDGAKLLGLSRSTLWRYMQERRIETVRLGSRMTRIRMETINRIVR